MHQTEGGFLKPLIFGGLDGILTSFAIVAGAAGGSMPVPVVLVLGFSNIFADALASEFNILYVVTYCIVAGLLILLINTIPQTLGWII